MIKRFLLTTGAAIISSSAFAADTVIVAEEPEPVEYVRVCDAFGNGYFYMPGTETCLRISGYVWFQVGAAQNRLSAEIGGQSGSSTFGDETYTNSTRARVNFDSRSSTEWGDLASRIRVQADWGDNKDGNATIDQAWLRLGGLFMGYSESYWVNAFDTGASNWGSHSWGGLAYGYQQRQLIGYTFNQNNFFISMSAEHDEGSDEGSNDYTPDFTAKIGGTFGPATMWIKGAYDSSKEALSAGAGVAADIGPGNLRILGFYANKQTNYGANHTINLPTSSPVIITPEWSAIVSYSIPLTEQVSASIGGQYSHLKETNDNVTGKMNIYQAEGSVVWTPVENFSVRSELTYSHYDTELTNGTIDAGVDGSRLAGFLRLQRDF